MKNLKPQFIAHLQTNPGWHASGHLQRMEWRDPSRKLPNEGKIAVEYWRNHAYYSAKEVPPKFRYEQLPDGSVREMAVT